METTGGDLYWLNINNERHNRIIHNMVIASLLDSNKHKNKFCCAAEISAEVHRCRVHLALDNISPHFAWYGKNLVSMNLEYLDVIYTPSHHILKS